MHFCLSGACYLPARLRFTGPNIVALIPCDYLYDYILKIHEISVTIGTGFTSHPLSYRSPWCDSVEESQLESYLKQVVRALEGGGGRRGRNREEEAGALSRFSAAN